MFRAFNMGVGMIVIAAPSDGAAILDRAAAQQVQAWRIGAVEQGTGGVVLN
jgi:phosphoribosylaminoimidazole (AIR) synthetase